MDSIKKLLASAETGRFLRFCVTGCMNTGVDFVIYTLLTSAFGMDVYLAQVFSYSAGMVNSYCVNRSWTFQSREHFFSRELLRFVLVNLIVLVLSMGVLYFFNTALSLHYLISKLFTVGFTMVFGFVLNRLVVFH